MLAQRLGFSEYNKILFILIALFCVSYLLGFMFPYAIACFVLAYQMRLLTRAKFKLPVSR